MSESAKKQFENFKAALADPKLFFVLMMGFASGLPYLLIGGTLKLWLSNVGIDIKTIGLFSIIGTVYTLKILWAPFMDRFTPPFLGRRRGWLLITQIGLLLSLYALGTTSPEQALTPVFIFALLTAFFSASQDVVVDAYRREVLTDQQLGLGSSLYVLGYRIGMLVATSLAPILSDQMSWQKVYWVMASFVFVGIITTFFAPEPEIHAEKPKRLFQDALWAPLKDYFTRPHAVVILIFIFLFKVGDSMAGSLLKPYYSAMGFSNTDIGAVAGPTGIWAAIVGGIVGGTLLIKISMKNALFYFGILQALSTLCLASLTLVNPESHNLYALGGVIFFETFTGGMGTAAFVAYMASLTDKRYTAFQYSLLTGAMSLASNTLSASAGFLQSSLGWGGFFILCASIALPGLYLILKFEKWGLFSPNRSSQAKE